jgi:hypothetical protein
MLMRWGGVLMVLFGVGAALAFAPFIVDAVPGGIERPMRPDPLYCAVIGGFSFLTGWVLVSCAVAVRKIEHLRSSTRRRLDMIERHTLTTSASTQQIVACGTSIVEALARADSKHGGPVSRVSTLG